MTHRIVLRGFCCMLVGCVLLIGISAPADPQAARDELLIDAVRAKDFAQVETLLASGANPNARNDFRMTPLHYAAGDGPRKLIRLLVKHGADLDARDSSGRTPLVEAAGSLRPDAVAFLLTLGAKPDPNALRQAAWLGRVEAVRSLLDAKVDPNAGLSGAGSNRSTEILELLLERGAKVDSQDESGTTALREAAAYGQLKNIKLLLSRGANPSLPSHDGTTALHVAINGLSPHDTNHELLRLLIEAKACLDCPNNEGVTPLRMAAIQHSSAYPILLQAAGGVERQPHQALKKFRQPTVPFTQLITDLAPSQDDDKRRAAQLAIVARGEEAIPDLIRTFEGTDIPDISLNVVAKMGPDAKAMIPVLLRLSDQHPEYTMGVMVTLDGIVPGTIRALPTSSRERLAANLHQFITSIPPGSADEGLRTALAMRALNFIPDAGKLHLLRYLRSKNPNERRNCAEALSSRALDDQDIVTQLSELATADPDDQVRMNAIRTLGGGDPKNDKIRATLLGVVRDPRSSDFLASTATLSLCRFGPRVIDDLLPLLTPIDSTRRIAIVSSLQQLHAGAIPRLMELLDHDNRSIAASASVILREMYADTVPALSAALQSPSDRVVESAVSVLDWKFRAAQPAVPRLLEIVVSNRRPTTTRVAAARVALAASPESRSADAVKALVPLLINWLSHKDHKVRREAARALGLIGPSAVAAAPTLKKIIATPITDNDGEASNLQSAAAEALTLITTIPDPDD